MPSYLQGKKRDQSRFVLLDAILSVYYNWDTKDLASLAGVSQGDLTTALGHILTVPADSLVIVNANAPKPPRVTKVIVDNPDATQQGNASTFCAFNKLRDARASGWKRTKRKTSVTLTKNARTVSAGVKLSNGLIQIRRVNANDFNLYKDDLGWIDPETINTDNERAKLFEGGSSPLPGLAKKSINGRDVIKPYSDGTTLGTGWVSIQDEELF